MQEPPQVLGSVGLKQQIPIKLNDAPSAATTVAQGSGAIGSAPVSKTGGCEFESRLPCYSQ